MSITRAPRHLATLYFGTTVAARLTRTLGSTTVPRAGLVVEVVTHG